MKKLIFTTSILALCFFTACEKEKEPIPASEYIVITEFSPKTAFCWQNFNTDTAYLFNSKEELRSFVCTDIPDINFNAYSLIIACGKTTYDVDMLAKNLQKIPTNKYVLNVDIRLGMTAFPESWKVAVLSSKLPDKAILTLNKVEHF